MKKRKKLELTREAIRALTTTASPPTNDSGGVTTVRTCFPCRGDVQ